MSFSLRKGPTVSFRVVTYRLRVLWQSTFCLASRNLRLVSLRSAILVRLVNGRLVGVIM